MTNKKMHWSSGLRQALGGSFPAMGNLGFRLATGILPKNLRGEIFPGVAVDLDLADSTMLTTYWQGKRFESPTGQILHMWCQGAERFFDIGSNYGFFSWWAATHYHDLLVYPFEPNPNTFNKVRTITDENCLINVYPQHFGLGDDVDVLELHPGIEDSGHSTFGSHPGLTKSAVATVSVLPFDLWLEQHSIDLPASPLWVTKIDVEGFELKVLRGMERALLAQAFRGISVEINEFTLGFCGVKPQDIFQFMADKGYIPIEESPSGQKWPVNKTANTFFVPA